MVLSPLAVILLAQLGLVLFIIVFFQRLQKKRLLKELQSFKSSRQPFFAGDQDTDADIEEDFDRQQAELLLNRIYKSSQNIISEAPAAKALCLEQQALMHTLGECLAIQLEPMAAEPASKEIVSQEQIDTALGREEALEEFDMMDLDGLETSADAIDDDDLTLIEEDELPEDTLQAAIDRMGDFDLSDLEDELQKIDDD